MKYYALVDCNNFYASCERAFQPRLLNRPVIVLSNNDGCIIARSNEAKALGIEMGVPYWEVRSLLAEHNVQVFSSNYALYGDMSARVMDTLQQHCIEVEVYSIDEAFLQLSYCKQGLQQYGEQLRQVVHQNTGIPVSVGIARTKTLAKLANHIAKQQTPGGVYLLHPADPRLSSLSISKVWGIGKAYEQKLGEIGIQTVAGLQQAEESWMRQTFGVVGLRLLKELKGEACYALEPPATGRAHTMVSRSFRRDIYQLEELKEAISVYASRLGEKLRRYRQAANQLTIFLWANPHKNRRADGRCYFAMNLELPLATSNTNTLIQWAAAAVERLYEEGTNYKKAGILAGGLQPGAVLQTNLFVGEQQQLRYAKAIEAMDRVNRQYGRHTVYFASCGNGSNTWSRKEQWRSPRFTTRWEEVLRVK
ncbi:MAG: Y-family DNA polymerase [Lewinellaceae bacterium]|nr:Y-family DNA polymerase [Phaeodactylibacter sp.]MCB9352160.1 Y-family DNA polymerase [Lewinellaceae bacterium]